MLDSGEVRFSTVQISIRPEFVLNFKSIDRFLYRVSELDELGDAVSPDLLERLDDCLTLCAWQTAAHFRLA